MAAVNANGWAFSFVYPLAKQEKFQGILYKKENNI